MPPKNKYTKEQIIAAAIEIVRAEGAEAVTARSVAAKLGCSVAPIFSVFSTMDELQEEIKEQVQAIYLKYVNDGLKEKMSFRGAGLSYLKFAMTEPNLFRLLFMSADASYGLDNVLSEIEVNYKGVYQSVLDCYGFNEADSKRLYLHMWIYTHGIAVLCVTGTCKFTEEQISDMLKEACISLVKEIRSKQ